MRSALLALGLGSVAMAYTVAIKDTDPYREVCSGMYGGKNAYIELAFDDTSDGQVALVIYEWSDVGYLGVETTSSSEDDYQPKTYICTTSAVRSGLCTTSQLGSFITSLPSGVDESDTSIFTTALQFDATSFPTGSSPGSTSDTVAGEIEDEGTDGDVLDEIDGGASAGDVDVDDAAAEYAEEVSELEAGDRRRAWGFGSSSASSGTGDEDEDEDGASGDDELAESEGVDTSVAVALPAAQDDDDETEADIDAEIEAEQEGEIDEGEIDEGDGEDETTGDIFDEVDDDTGSGSGSSTSSGSSSSATSTSVPKYTAPITYSVPKTGYYCVGVVPVTLVTTRSLDTTAALAARQLGARQSSANHAAYEGTVLFKNTFAGELPAVEYPKITLYGVLSLVYVVLAAAWGFLCFKHFRELLPMQYYISGTIIFLVVEMLAQFTYYRYINKHGGNAGALAFLFVIGVLNAARNSLSFFLLLIVAMGLSVVTPTLGSVMGRVRLLTIFHFVFGVLYSVGTVQVELDNASLIVVLILIFPLALTLTAFLMWIIVSLNGTILHLQARKQRYKLQMFQRLWRILILAVIAVGAFFVISSISLSNRLDEDYAPSSWRYRWILLDGSLAAIYLAVFTAIAYLWRPSANNIRFAMSTELAQDEAEAEDYEIGDLERGPGGPDHPGEDDDDDEQRRLYTGKHDDAHDGEGSVVFAMGDDSDDEGEGAGQGGHSGSPGGSKYKDDEGRGKDD